MSKFQILDEKRYALKAVGGNITKPVGYMGKFLEKDVLSFWRWEHRVTLGHNTREYMVFLDNLNNLMYIEEITGGHLEAIKDDSLHVALLTFASEKGFCNILVPLMKAASERYI